MAANDLTNNRYFFENNYIMKVKRKKINLQNRSFILETQLFLSVQSFFSGQLHLSENRLYFHFKTGTISFPSTQWHASIFCDPTGHPFAG